MQRGEIMNFLKKQCFLYILLLFVLLGLSVSCVSRKIERTSVDTVTDLSGRWNDTDSRLVSEQMIHDMLSRSWIDEFRAVKNKKPAIIAGYVKNRSSEHIETTTFVKDIERALINSGKASVVASSSERNQIRAERLDQQSSASLETIKQLGEEIGADFILIGLIVTQNDALDKKSTVVYQVDLELINIETNAKSWIGTKKIKKLITQRSIRG